MRLESNPKVYVFDDHQRLVPIKAVYLTEREYMILYALRLAKPTRASCHECGMTESMFDYSVSKICKKLGMNRYKLVNLAIRTFLNESEMPLSERRNPVQQGVMK